jgi:CheY-like chemotaxis protein
LKVGKKSSRSDGPCARLIMASRIHSRELVDKPLRGDGARVLLVNNNPEDLSYYGGILQRLQCQVRTSLSFAKGAECLKHEHYDLIVLDQGGSKFEGWQVLMTAMEADAEIPVLVLARAYDRGCYEQAMQSGALDYVEAPLSEAEIVALLETFIPPRLRVRHQMREPRVKRNLNVSIRRGVWRETPGKSCNCEGGCRGYRPFRLPVVYLLIVAGHFSRSSRICEGIVSFRSVNSHVFKSVVLAFTLLYDRVRSQHNRAAAERGKGEWHVR